MSVPRGSSVPQVPTDRWAGVVGASALRDELTRRLAPLAHVDAYVSHRTVALVLACGRRAHAEGAAGFPGWLPALGARRVALASLAAAGGRPGADGGGPVGPRSAVRDWMRDQLAGAPDSVLVEGVGTGGDLAHRRALAAAAVTYQAGLRRVMALTGVRWQVVDPTGGARRWRLPHGAPVVGATVDARDRAPAADGSHRLLVLAGGPGLGARDRAAVEAVADGVVVGSVARTVTVAEPATGLMEEIPVDRSLLERGVALITEAVGVLGSQAPPARPGPGCRRCPVLDGCPEGTRSLASGARRGRLPRIPSGEDDPR